MPRNRGYFRTWNPLFAAASACVGAVLAGSQSVRGVIFYSTGDPNYNTTAPTGTLTNSGWQYEGLWGIFTATPISTHYFITAAHIGGTPGGTQLFYGNNAYNNIPFPDSSPYKDFGDLRLWRTDGTFTSYAPLWDTSVDGQEQNNNLVVIGRGRERGTEVRLPDMPSGTLKGWLWGNNTSIERWGENQVTAYADFAANGDQKLLEFDFDAPGNPGNVGANEAILAEGDSGGGVFIKSGNEYKLAGINYGVNSPFSYTQTGTAFNAAIFDAGGLWYRPDVIDNTQSPEFIPDGATDVPAGSYASRISQSLASLSAYLSPTWNVDVSGTWSVSSNWEAQVIGATGVDSEANFRGAITTARTVTLDSAQTVGNVYFDSTSSYTIAGSATLTLSVSSGSAGITVYSGNHTIAPTLALSSPVNIDVEPAGSVLTLSGDMSGGGSFTKIGAGRVDVKAVLTLGNLVVSAGTLRVLDNGLSTGVSIVSTVSVSAGAKLDLRNNKLIAHNSAAGTWNGTSYTGVSGLVATGRNGGNWSGTGGIVTSLTAATSGNFTSIGVARASDVRPATATATANWAGQTITGSDTLVMYTYGGDANLDGKINIDDYIRIDNGIAAHLTGWSNGDFNYDGKVNIDDYTQFIDANILTQGTPFSTDSGVGDGFAGVGAVPEPVIGVTIGIALPVFSIVRRRARR